jgi:hypothetical protein
MIIVHNLPYLSFPPKLKHIRRRRKWQDRKTVVEALQRDFLADPFIIFLPDNFPSGGFTLFAIAVSFFHLLFIVLLSSF